MSALDRLREANVAMRRAEASLQGAIRAARAEGMSLRAIAAILECSPETVRKTAGEGS